MNICLPIKISSLIFQCSITLTWLITLKRKKMPNKFNNTVNLYFDQEFKSLKALIKEDFNNARSKKYLRLSTKKNISSRIPGTMIDEDE